MRDAAWNITANETRNTDKQDKRELNSIYTVYRPEMRHCDWSLWSQLFEWWTKHVPCGAIFCSTVCLAGGHGTVSYQTATSETAWPFHSARSLHERRNVFLRWRSKLSWISSVKRLWEELLQELDHLGDLLHDRSREEAIKWAVRPCYSVISTVGGIFQVYLPSGLFFTLNKAYWVQHATEGLRWKGSCIRLFV